MKILGKLHSERLTPQDSLSIRQDQQAAHKEERQNRHKRCNCIIRLKASKVHCTSKVLETEQPPQTRLQKSIYILTHLGQLPFSLFIEIAYPSVSKGTMSICPL